MAANYDFEAFLKYQEMLDKCANENSPEIILNDSIVHAVLVFTKLLEKAIEDSNTHLTMYCGKLSLLRDSTRIKVEEECEKLKPQNDKLLDQWKKFRPFDKFRKVLETFLEREGNINIIIDKQNVKTFNGEPILSLINKHSSQFNIFQMPFSLGLNHFAFIGNSFRCENSDEKKTALCSFNSPEMVKQFENSFAMLSKMSKPFELISE